MYGNDVKPATTAHDSDECYGRCGVSRWEMRSSLTESWADNLIDLFISRIIAGGKYSLILNDRPVLTSNMNAALHGN
ncbi:hypothetical protein BST61_g6912 [Cercospora zeina]